jgi:hypothetical protein
MENEQHVRAAILLIQPILAEALSLANAAVSCAKTNNTCKAFTIALDVECLIHEANSLLQAASVFNRREPPPD